jgi:predicted transcriptional regulator
VPAGTSSRRSPRQAWFASSYRGCRTRLLRTVQADSLGFHAHPRIHAIGLGCPVSRARELIYSDGLDLDNPDGFVPVGVTCRLCERTDCEQRAFPSIRHPLRIDENVRGVSLYATVGAETKED